MMAELIGWKFTSEKPGCSPDPLYNSAYLKDLYFKANPEYQGRFTVPVLWDKKHETIVNNESSEIIRMLNSEFNHLAKYPKLDLYPEELRGEIDALNSWIYDQINNGVYKSGFATAQEAYEKNVVFVYDGLDKVEKILSEREFLTGGELTEADVRLFTTIVRYDPVYHTHCTFLCRLNELLIF